MDDDKEFTAPEFYERNGRTYELRQETGTDFDIRWERDDVGFLSASDDGWVAYGLEEELPDHRRTPDLETTLNTFLDRIV